MIQKMSSPLFYEAYPGSIPDVSQLTFAVDMASDLDYQNLRLYDQVIFQLLISSIWMKKGMICPNGRHKTLVAI